MPGKSKRSCKEISPSCLTNKHIDCASDACTCTCHTDLFLIDYFRRLFAERKAAERLRVAEQQTIDRVFNTGLAGSD